MINMRWLGLLLIALACCGADHNVELSFPDATPAEFDAAQAAAAEWNSVCPGVNVHITKGPGDVPVIVVPPDAVAPMLARTKRDYSKRPENMRVSAEWSTRRWIYAHEMGHALGLDHADHGIMTADVPWEGHVTPEDCP